MRKSWAKKAIAVVVYRGHRYRLYEGRPYFEASPPRGGFLHRHVWEDEKGPIPKGHDIHHVDENTLNNKIENFECLTKKEHRKRHPMVGEALEKQRKHMLSIGKQASVWHRSKEGIEWHKLQGRKCWENRKTTSKICPCCEKGFEAKFKDTVFCSSPCRQRHRLRGPDRLMKCTKDRGGRCKCLQCH